MCFVAEQRIALQPSISDINLGAYLRSEISQCRLVLQQLVEKLRDVVVDASDRLDRVFVVAKAFLAHAAVYTFGAIL